MQSNIEEATLLRDWLTLPTINTSIGGHDFINDHPAIANIVSSLVFFIIINRLTNWTVPKAVVESKRKNVAEAKWKWSNILTSLVHSSLSGLWAVIALLHQPLFGVEMIFKSNIVAYGLLGFSTGYFMYDFGDMSINSLKGSGSLLIHHIVISSSYISAMYSGLCIPFNGLSLLNEINSIFLHIRTLLLMSGYSKNSLPFRLNAVLNMGTFILFRFVLVGWMIFWCFNHRAEVHFAIFAVGFTTLVTIMGLNIELFGRILKSDYSSTRRVEKKQE